MPITENKTGLFISKLVKRDGDLKDRSIYERHLAFDIASVSGVGETSYIEDIDGDTRVHTEESPDEDIIRFDLGNTTLSAAREVLTIQAIDANDVKLEPTTDDDVDLGSSSSEFKNLYVDGSAYIDGLAENMLVAGTSQIQFYDTAIHISSATDGHLDLEADVSIDLNADTAVVGAYDFAVPSDQKVIFEGLAGDTYWKYNSGTTYLEGWVDGVKRVDL